MDTRSEKIRNIMILVLFLNLLVSIVKLSYGRITNTLSMQSDGYHSLFDGVSNIIGLIGIHIASKPPDSEHPYGHRKYETIASIFIAVLLIIVGFRILNAAFIRFNTGIIPEVTPVSFLIMIETMTINYIVAKYEHINGIKLKSEVLIADSMHTKSDIYVSLSVIIGLFAIKGGLYVLDPIIAILIAGIIFYAGFSIIRSGTAILCDTSQLNVDEIHDLVCDVEGVLGCHDIRTRGTAENIYIDLHVEVQSTISTFKSHEIADIVENKLKNHFKGVNDVMVHIEPASPQKFTDNDTEQIE
ncbi:MAG: cation transporter [Methanomethylovorans sp.]|nr:cation transporter [Methanomethylovorans sp.]